MNIRVGLMSKELYRRFIENLSMDLELLSDLSEYKPYVYNPDLKED